MKVRSTSHLQISSSKAVIKFCFAIGSGGSSLGNNATNTNALGHWVLNSFLNFLEQTVPQHLFIFSTIICGLISFIQQLYCFHGCLLKIKVNYDLAGRMEDKG